MRRLEPSDHDLARRFLKAFPEAGSDVHLLVAVSGGSDSLALLELLQDARSLVRARAKCTAVYVDHRQREGTVDEAAAVAHAAHECGALFETVAIDDPARNSEAELRRQRYAALENVAARVGAAWILTGHTRDDQIETFVMRVVRGAGRLGLSGIPARRGKLVRPLLDMTRAELRAYLDRRGRRWSDDPSNAQDRYTRNRLRADVIPAVHRAFGPSALEHIPALAERLGLEEEYLEREARRYCGLVVVDGGRSIDLAALADVPQALRGRLLRAWLGDVAGGVMIGLRQLGELEKLASSNHGSARIDVAGVVLERRYDRISTETALTGCYAQPFLYKVEAASSARFVGPHGAWEITVRPCPEGPPARARGPHRESLDISAEALGEDARLRPAGQGDRIDSAGHGMRKVRDIMTDRRLPRALREAWPVLATDTAVLWVPGLAVARHVAADQSDRGRLRLEWKGLHI